ncbi:ABC transporter permease subunit [Quadrisphaera sp. DSM 44207]|uniref:ABC transporter permease subunit n=1 Tax=Quadrisphaera sp. DSM 44207 TaxID=1881057 RepID=UPI001C40AF25|nr:ABC transporter permease subunit [Quadrisphaera sp. DSM 44207]
MSNDWVCPRYVATRWQQLLDAALDHVGIAAAAVALGVLLAVPLALLARALPHGRGAVLGLATLVYTVPSLALFSLLLPFFGITRAVVVVVVGLALYSLVVLVRAVVVGLDGVDPRVVEAARGMGYGPARLLWSVQAPLALPAVLAGLRVAVVSTVALTTVGALLGEGGLGQLVLEGLRSNFRAQVLTASALTVVLALVADALVLLLQRAALPWRRAAR